MPVGWPQASPARKVGSLRCRPYHSWAYRLEGDLLHAPWSEEIDGFERDCGAGPSWVLVLLEALANAGAAFDPAAALAARRWARIRDEELHPGRR